MRDVPVRQEDRMTAPPRGTFAWSQFGKRRRIDWRRYCAIGWEILGFAVTVALGVFLVLIALYGLGFL